MEFSSTIYHYATNPNAKAFEETAYNSNDPNWVWKDNTVYMRKTIWGNAFRTWLNDVGIDYDVNNPAVYTPVAHVENGIVTGYHTQYPNASNRFLDMKKSTRELYYPNLYFVQIGIHPYPKEGRYNHTWLVDMFHRECHRIIYPDPDPKKFFFFLKDIQP